mgnify:FL=1
MKQRIITAIIGILIVIPIILYGSWPFTLTVYFLATVALYELLRMFSFKRPLILALTVFFLWSFIFFQGEYHFSHTLIDVKGLLLFYLLVYLILVVLSKNKFTINDVSRLLFAILFLGFSFHYMLYVREYGLHLFLFILFVIWATDTGAYFTGRRFGKRKLWPAISPNKTIGGALGGILFALIVANVFHLFYSFDLSFFALNGVALLISIFGQLGDLVASSMKRAYDIKDFGRIFPGHGGVLDRLDSFIFVLLLLQMLNIF